MEINGGDGEAAADGEADGVGLDVGKLNKGGVPDAEGLCCASCVGLKSDSAFEPAPELVSDSTFDSANVASGLLGVSAGGSEIESKLSLASTRIPTAMMTRSRK